MQTTASFSRGVCEKSIFQVAGVDLTPSGWCSTPVWQRWQSRRDSPGKRSTTGAPGCGVSGWQARQKILPPWGLRFAESARTFGKSSRSEGKSSERPWTRWQFRQVVPAAGTLPRG